MPRNVVAVMAPLGDAGARSRWDVDFWVDDADASAARAVELGRSLIAPPHDVPGFRRAVIADPQGAALSISRLLGFPGGDGS